MFAEYVGITEDLCYSLDDGHNLIPPNESIQASAEIRLSRKSSGNTKRKSDFGRAVHFSSDCCQANVVDLRIRAPGVASCDRDLELARQIVEIGVPSKELRDFEHERRSVDNFVSIDPGNRATGHVADDVAAGSCGIQANLPKAIENLWQRFNRDPM